MKMTCPALHIERQGNTVKPRGSPRNSLHFGDVSPSPFLTCIKPQTLTYRNLAHISHTSDGGPGVLFEIEHLVVTNTRIVMPTAKLPSGANLCYSHLLCFLVVYDSTVAVHRATETAPRCHQIWSTQETLGEGSIDGQPCTRPYKN